MNVKAYFTNRPEYKVTDVIVNLINHFDKSIYIRAYNYCSKPINDAILNAIKRKVHVEQIVDFNSSLVPYCLSHTLHEAGAKVWTDKVHKIAHDKIIVGDEKIVITGSFNFSAQAETNAENIIVINDPVIAQAYLEDHNLHKKHCTPYPNKTRRELLHLNRFIENYKPPSELDEE